MTNSSIEFNTQLELDVMLNGMTEVTKDYVRRFSYLFFTDVVIPEGVKSIESGAFADCIVLERVTISNSVTKIGEWAFKDCYDLTNITIPDSVTSIEDYAFYGCRRLTNVMFKGKTRDELRSMPYYPWGLSQISSVQVA